MTVSCLLPASNSRIKTHKFLHERKLSVEKNIRKRAPRAIVRVAMRDIVDADPDREERIFARPRARRGLLPRPRKELRDLVHDGHHRRQVGHDEVRVDRGAVVCVVVRQDFGFVVDDGVHVDPVGPAVSYGYPLHFGDYR